MPADYFARWVLIGVCAVVADAWLAALRIPIDVVSLVAQFVFMAVFLFFSAISLCIGSAFSRLCHPATVAADFGLSFAQLFAALTALLPLSYLSATAGFPLMDGVLARLDAAIGFDWDTAARWVGERPALDQMLQVAYHSPRFQLLAILLIGSLKRPGDRNSELIWLFIVSVLITAAAAAFTPAAGKSGHLDYLDLFMKIRNGDWLIMTYTNAKGVVTFPSYHATEAILLTYLVRHYRWGLAAFGSLNAVVLLATPTVGGHYLVDLFGGAVVAGLSIAIVRLMYRYMAHSNASRAVPAACSAAPAGERIDALS